jgi:hypothetical protein
MLHVAAWHFRGNVIAALITDRSIHCLVPFWILPCVESIILLLNIPVNQSSCMTNLRVKVVIHSLTFHVVVC